MYKSQEKSKPFLILLFLLAPLLSVIVAAKFYRKKIFDQVVWLFFGFMGLIIVTTYTGSDVHRYHKWFEKYTVLDDYSKSIFFKDDVAIEIFRPASFYIVSKCSSNPQIYFAFVALLFGYFYVGILRLLLNSLRGDFNLLKVLVVLNFVFLFNFVDFQFVRSTLAKTMFIYYYLLYCRDDKIKYLLGSSLSILIHFMMVLPSFILLIHYLLNKKSNIKLLYIFFVLSSFILIFDFTSLKSLIETYLPEDLETKKGYLNEDYKENVDSAFNSTNWYIKYYGEISKYTLIYLSYLLVFKVKQCGNQLTNVLRFAFLFGIVANIVSVVPSGHRFFGIAYPLIWFVVSGTILGAAQKFPSAKFPRFIWIVFFFFITIGLRFVFDVMPLEFFLGNPVLAFFETSNVPLIDIIK